jgi:hypothetical protein
MVWIGGEGFFDVTHTINHRKFIVHTQNDMDVRVLGTKFNVRIRSETEVMLQEGKVNLEIGRQKSASIGNNMYYNWLNENTLNYSKQINENNFISLLGGITFQKNVSESFDASALELELASGGQNAYVELVNRWTPENPSNLYPKATTNSSAVFSDSSLKTDRT